MIQASGIFRRRFRGCPCMIWCMLPKCLDCWVSWWWISTSINISTQWLSLNISEADLRLLISAEKADTLVNSRRGLKKNPSSLQAKARYRSARKECNHDLRHAKLNLLAKIEAIERKNIRLYGFINSSKMSDNTELVALKRQLKSIDHFYNYWYVLLFVIYKPSYHILDHILYHLHIWQMWCK